MQDIATMQLQIRPRQVQHVKPWPKCSVSAVSLHEPNMCEKNARTSVVVAMVSVGAPCIGCASPTFPSSQTAAECGDAG